MTWKYGMMELIGRCKSVSYFEDTGPNYKIRFTTSDGPLWIASIFFAGSALICLAMMIAVGDDPGYIKDD